MLAVSLSPRNSLGANGIVAVSSWVPWGRVGKADKRKCRQISLTLHFSWFTELFLALGGVFWLLPEDSLPPYILSAGRTQGLLERHQCRPLRSKVLGAAGSRGAGVREGASHTSVYFSAGNKRSGVKTVWWPNKRLSSRIRASSLTFSTPVLLAGRTMSPGRHTFTKARLFIS